MNDIETKVNAHNAAKQAVARQSANIANSNNVILQAQNQYLQSVIHTATLNERVRRKKDRLQGLIIWGSLVVIWLITLMMNPIVGLVFFGLVAIIAYAIHHNTKDQKALAYSHRKEFFEKYAGSIAPADQLKWKNGAIVYTNASAPTTGGWTCPFCQAKNTDRANFCVYCGAPKQ